MSLKIPPQYLPVMPYLILDKAQDFLTFSKEVFDASEQMVVPSDGDIMHGEIRIQDAVIMFASATPEWKQRNSSMYLYVEDVKKVYRKALTNSAISLQEPVQKEYGFTAGFEDPFGHLDVEHRAFG